MKIPLCIPSIDENDIASVVETLKSGWLAHGPKVNEFQSFFSSYIGTKHAIPVNSWTSGAHLIIQALGIKGEIIIPSFSFVATANVCVTAGARPVFCDIDYETCTINPDEIDKLITEKTEAIMPVHYAGQTANMKAISKIAERNNLHIIEDSAECIGGTYDGKKAGSFDIGCFSFYPVKNIATGEGGMVTTNDDVLAEKIRILSAHGITNTAFSRLNDQEPWEREAIMAGYNFRMSDINAALGVTQMKKLDYMNKQRRIHASYLTKSLNEIEGIIPPVEAENCFHVYQMYTIKVERVDRSKFIHMLRDIGIGASVHFDPPIHLQPAYKGQGGELPVTEKVARSIVTLPMYPELTQKQLDYIIMNVEKCASACRK
jgi:perosamine synthetase